MDNREVMKHELITKLAMELGDLSQDTLSLVSTIFDIVSRNYTITKDETQIAIWEQERLSKLIKTYIVVKKMEGLSDNTLDRYLLYLNQFLLSNRKPIDQITGNDVRMFLFDYQMNHNVSNRTLDGIRSIICTFFKWAASENYIQKNPADTIKSIRFEEKPRRPLEQIELERLRRACKTPRDLAILETLYSTGCRVSELIGIKLSDIDWDKHTVNLFGKGRKHRVSFINAKAEVAIREYLKKRKCVSNYLFCGERNQPCLKKEAVERVIRIIGKNAGIQSKKITPHVIRHTTATQALRNGMPISDIQTLLGHANVATTMIYAHTTIDNVRSNHLRCVV